MDEPIREVSHNLKPHVMQIFFLARNLSKEFNISLESSIQIVESAIMNQRNDVLCWIKDALFSLSDAITSAGDDISQAIEAQEDEQ